MNSSGIKRGLASSAIAALAVAGLPLLASTANAVTLNNGFGANTVAFANANANPSTLSIKADGTDSTVRLEAIAGSSVTSLAFEYSINGGTAWVPIGTATADDGAFSYDWAPPASIVNVPGLQIRALANGGTTAAATLTNQVISATANSTNITAGSALGVFQSPYGTNAQNVIVSGTASYNGNVNVDIPGIAASAASFAAAPVSGSTTNVWSGVVNIDGYSYGTTDQLLVRTSAAANSGEDFEAFSLYKQVITTVTATADKTNLPAGGPGATVTVTVKDQNGNPIAGARVGKVGSDAAPGALTNAKGQITFTQNPGTTAAYYADATASLSYEAAVGDKKSDDVTVGQYVAAPTTLAGASADGAAFDFDEYIGGPADQISVQVKDQNGANIDATGQSLQYYWVVTPFSGATPIYLPSKDVSGNPTFTTNNVQANGKFNVPLPAGQPAGTYELYSKLTANGLGNGAIAASKVLTVKAGNAAITFAPNGKTQAAAGATASATGTLALDDGTPLPGRTVRVAYSQSSGGGSSAQLLAADGTAAPGNTRDFVTGTDGTFKADIKDVVETNQPVETGTLTANTLPDIITATPDASEAVEFVKSLTPAQVLIDDPASISTAGTTKTYTVTVNADSDPVAAGVQAQALANTDVTLTLDHGFFTDGTDAAAPTVGADTNNLKNLGTTITVKTNASGQATVKTTIGRDAGFDDDGAVAAKITATAGSATVSDTDDWTSASPINGGTASIDLAPAAFQQSTVLPDARDEQSIAFDVILTDQFGNKVPGETYSVAGTGSLAGFTTTTSSDTTVDNDIVVLGSQTALGAGSLKVTWVADTSKYAAPLPTVAAGTETLTDTADVNVYAYDINTATLSLENDVNGTAPVGTAVTETVKVLDAKGQPVQYEDVDFLRQGPGNVTDGDPNSTPATNAKGEAYYSFTGTSAGVARISAVISGDTGRKTLTDEVTFTGATAPTAIKVTLTGDDNGAKDDRLVVTTTGKAAGADITIYKVKKNGKRGGVVATATVNNSGTTKVTVPDTNGKKSTKYVAVVSATSDTKAGTSNKKTVK